jgi:hypothetical protein
MITPLVRLRVNDFEMTGAERVWGLPEEARCYAFRRTSHHCPQEVGIIFDPDLKILCEPLAESGLPNLVRKILFF